MAAWEPKEKTSLNNINELTCKEADMDAAKKEEKTKEKQNSTAWYGNSARPVAHASCCCASPRFFLSAVSTKSPASFYVLKKQKGETVFLSSGEH